MTEIKTIYFDLDGTIANLYTVEGWLPMLRASDPTPYIQAKPMVNMSALARLLHKAQRNNIKIGVVSWLSKNATEEYNKAVELAKLEWLAKHLPSVVFDEVVIAKYGTPKSTVVKNAECGILFDDEENNRNEWTGVALPQTEIMRVLKEWI